MTNLLVYLCLLLVFVYFSLKLFHNPKKFNSNDFLLFSNLFLILWLIIHIFYLTEYIEELAVLWYSLGIAAKSFVISSLLIFYIKLINPIFKLRKSLILTFFVMPAMNFVFAVNNSALNFFFSNIEMQKIFDRKQIIFTNGIWFYVDYLYCLALSVIPLFLLLKRYRSVHSMARTQYITISAGFLINSVAQLLCISDFSKNFNIGLIGICAGSILFYIAVTSEELEDSILFAQDALFQQMTIACFVTETDGRIIEYNPEAERLFKPYELKFRNCYFDDIIRELVETNKVRFIYEGDRQILQFLSSSDLEKYFRISKTDIKNSEGVKIGNFIEIANTTTERERIIELNKIKKDLENMANRDPLTDLYNRRYFHTMSCLYNNDEYLPLCVVSCDLNGLKQTNDTYGHKAGDSLIVLAANILKLSAPEDSVVTRQGGDEFMILIPNATEIKAIRFLETVYQKCKETNEEPFGSPSISMGFAIKYDIEEPINNIIDKADFLMYESKRNFKGKDLAEKTKYERAAN